jgi:hypothetical protein
MDLQANDDLERHRGRREVIDLEAIDPGAV